MSCENCKCETGPQEAQRLHKEETLSKPGPTPGADNDDSPQPGTEDVPS